MTGALRAMVEIRAFEARLLARPDRGFQLASSGAEAVAVGLAGATGPDDPWLCSGRSIGPALARGVPAAALFAELLGRVAGPNRGRAGRGHLSDPDHGLFGAHAVVGGNLTIAAGVALALRQQGADAVAVCVFGDGACGQGALHEAMNLAALWRLPLLFVCDDNGWSVSTPRAEALAPADLSALAAPFGLARAHVDGTDVDAVRAAAATLRAHARAEGPAFLWCESVRLEAHSTATRETRSPADLAAARARDPIARERARLRAAGALDDAGEAALRAEVDRALDAALAEALASPFPDPEDLLADVG